MPPARCKVWKRTKFGRRAPAAVDVSFVLEWDDSSSSTRRERAAWTMPRGETIRLQPVTPDDAELLSRWSDDPGFATGFQDLVPTPPQVWEQQLRNRPFEPERNGLWLVIGTDSDLPMGMVLHFEPSAVPHYRGLEIGWELRPEFRGRGIATEAARILVNYLFNLTPVQRIQAVIVAENEASCRVAERVGMQHEGLCRRAGFVRGSFVDLRLYSILREEWQNEASYTEGRIAL